MSYAIYKEVYHITTNRLRARIFVGFFYRWEAQELALALHCPQEQALALLRGEGGEVVLEVTDSLFPLRVVAVSYPCADRSKWQI